MSKKMRLVAALVGMCALSLFLLNCGTSSSRPSGVLYVLTQGSNGIGNNVTSFAMDLYSGNLSLVNSNASTCPATATQTNTEPCGLPLDILLDPTGATAFVLNQGTPCVQQGNRCVTGSDSVLPTIYSYTVNSDGSLSAPNPTPVYWTCIVQPVAPCSATNSYPDTAVAMVRDAAGQFLFVIDEGVYPSPPTCPAIARAAASSADAMAFVGCPSISVFAMNGSTTLTSVSQSSTYQSPFFLSKTPSALSPITFTPPGGTAEELLFATNNYDLCTVACVPSSTPNDDTVSIYTVSSSGVLSEQPNSPYAISAASPSSVQAVNTDLALHGGLFVYVGQSSGVGAIYPFTVCWLQNANCSPEDVAGNLMVPLATCLSQSCVVPPSSVGSNPVQMLVDPTSNFLYVLSEGENQVSGFSIGTSTGKLSPLPTPTQPTGSQPVSMAMHASVNSTGQSLYNNQSGQFLYTSNTTSSNITGFTLSTTSGVMSNPITVITPAAPSGVAVH
ncbi:MAG: hypothetical protein ABSD76_00430 [Terriglobales bacterium]